MKRFNKVLLFLLLLPAYAIAANYPVDNLFCSRPKMVITKFILIDAVKSPKETWGINNSAYDSVYPKDGCLYVSVGLTNKTDNANWVKTVLKNINNVKVSKDTTFADIYGNDKTPGSLYFALFGNITFKISDGTTLYCENVAIGKGNTSSNGNWWLYNNSNEAPFNKTHTLRCQNVDTGEYVAFSTEVIKKNTSGGGWGPPTITSYSDDANEVNDQILASDDEQVSDSNDEVAAEKKFGGAPRITSFDQNQ